MPPQLMSVKWTSILGSPTRASPKSEDGGGPPVPSLIQSDPVKTTRWSSRDRSHALSMMNSRVAALRLTRR